MILLTGMIPAGKIDPELQKSSCRDDFQRGNASWFSRIVVQGWFSVGRFILICEKVLTGMIPAGKIDPELQKSSCRDDFQWGDSSWFAKKLLQGWFPSGKCILICRKALAGMISSGEIDPELQKSSCRDDSRREIHPDLVGLQESREKPCEMSTK